MRYLNNQTQEKLPYIQTYIYTLFYLRNNIERVYICPWLSNGRKIFNIWYFNPVQDGGGGGGGGKKGPPNSFSPVTSTNVGIGL